MVELLGPFLGYITESAVKIWLRYDDPAHRDVYVSIHAGQSQAAIRSAHLHFQPETYYTDCVLLDGLSPNQRYHYRLWLDAAHSLPLDLQGLVPEDLYFWTLPLEGYENHQLDFVLMSCHNPQTYPQDHREGFGVWSSMPPMVDIENRNVRFALLIGDQVYADEIEQKLLKETDPAKCEALYVSIYQKFWDNIHYRRILCSLPAILMWDDHDITDGWGSRLDSFDKKHPDHFKPEWQRLFQAARAVFIRMQAIRNPDPLTSDYSTGFDTCFKIGRAGFAVMDLRSNRNVKLPRIALPDQRTLVRKWVADNKQELDTLFLISTVVFSHGAPQLDNFILKTWIWVLKAVKWLKRTILFKKPAAQFSANIGDLRDDINDSWGADVNAAEADIMLDMLFDIQNDPQHPLNVVILSGDIHTPGYATLYSREEKHKERASIPHITISPVAYKPFSWIGEAVYRHMTRAISLGKKGSYYAQVSHHFCRRCMAVLSIRDFATDSEPEHQLKVKYYLEGFPEPQIMLFDLRRSSHREDIDWA